MVSTEFKDNWDASRERFHAFWQREIVDRCCIAVRSRRKGASPIPPRDLRVMRPRS